MPIIPLILGIITAVTGYLGYQQISAPDKTVEALGAFGDPFLSIQLADSPQNTYILQTDGTNNSWVANLGGGGGGGIFSTTTGGVAYQNSWEVVHGATATSVAGVTLEVNGLLYADNASSSLSSFNVAWGNLLGSLTGNASTASALAANGANCSAGNAPLGVDASGAVESCFDVWTEAENTAAAYLGATDSGQTLTLASVSGSTYSTLQDLQNVFHSAGYVSGGTITDIGGGAVSVAAGTGLIRSSDSDVAQLLYTDWSASSSIAVTTDTTFYIGIEYNAGTPIVTWRSSNDFDGNTDFMLGTVTNDNGTLHISNTPIAVGDHARYMISRVLNVNGLQRDNSLGGLIVTETGTRNLAMTTGSIWHGLRPQTIGALDTSVSDTFDYVYQDGVGGWTVSTGQTQWNNTQYDDGSGTLQTMTNNRWANLFIWIELDGDMIVKAPVNEYVSQAEAESEGIPTTVPSTITNHGFFIARLTFQKSAASAATIVNPFTTNLSAAATADHGNLAGLSDDDHTQYLLANGTRLMTGSITLAGNPALASGDVFLGDNGLIFEGTTADTLEGLLTSADITSTDKTWTLPNTTGTIALTSSAMTGTFDGNNFTAVAQGDILYGSAAGTVSNLAKDTNATRYLSNTGTSNNPAWAQINLSNGVTGTLPAGNGGTGITSLGAGIATWLGTPSSANLAAALTGETGSGAVMFGTSPTITTSFTFDGITVDNLTGADTSIVTGTAGTNGNLVQWNADGDAVDSGLATANVPLLNGEIDYTGTHDFDGATVAGLPYYPAFTYATTSWSGSTTIPIGVAYNAQTWGGVKCYTDVGTLFVEFSDGTNVMNDFQASTTVGTITLSSNNTFTAGEKRYVEIGTPASSPTKISCTVSYQDN